MKFHPPQTIVSPLTVVQRERVLPVPGEILVQEGERVEPVQVIGRAFVPTAFQIMNVGRNLGVRPSVAHKYMRVKPGQRVKQGEVVAELRGLAALFSVLFGISVEPCRSPFDGTVTDSGAGRVLIEAFPREVELRANFYGVVTHMLPEWGASIRVTGALCQGVWGNRQEGSGVLKLLARDRDRPIRPRSIDASCSGTVIIGGSRLNTAVLEKATEIQVRGIVTGSIEPEALDAARAALFPIIVTEGVGEYPMCSRIYRLLASNDGREATLDARFKSRWGAQRPEIIVPLPAEPQGEVAQIVDAPLQAGDTVRVMRAPHVGVVGAVIALPVWTHTAAGAHLPAARIRSETDKDELLVPLHNLEILR